MILKVFCVYDSKAEAYLTPFFLPTVGQALRAFSDTANDNTTNIYRHPGDYTLFQVGEFDAVAGKFLQHDAKINLGMAQEFKKQITFEELKQQNLSKLDTWNSEAKNG